MLETQISDLTKEVRDLRITIDKLFLHLINEKQPEESAPPAEKPKPKVKAKPEPKAEAPAPEITHTDLQQMCLAMVREDRALKTKIKDALGEYGAKVMADVPEDKLAELKTVLEGLK